MCDEYGRLLVHVTAATSGYNYSSHPWLVGVFTYKTDLESMQRLTPTQKVIHTAVGPRSL